MSYYMHVDDLKKRLRLSMPTKVTLPDIVQGGNFTINRADLMDLLLINPESLVLESQAIPALYAEMGKMQRCAKKAADEAATAYRTWKQVQSKHFKAQHPDKKPTGAAVEEYYRTLADYANMSNAESYFLNLSYLFGDLKDAFKLKADLVRSNQNYIQGFERVEKVSGEQRPLYTDTGVPDPELDEAEQHIAAMVAAENQRIAAGSDHPGIVETEVLPGMIINETTEVPDPPSKTSRSTRKPAQGKKNKTGSTKKGKGK